MKKGISTLLTVCLTAVIALGLAAGGWYYLDKQNKEERDNLQAQISNLQDQIAASKEEASESTTSQVAEQSDTSASSSASGTANSTSGWKTYANSTYGFSFKYPENFTVTVNTDMPGGPEIAINPTSKILKVNNQSVNLFNFNWHQNVGEAISLKNFVAEISAESKTNTTVASYPAVKAANINSSKVDQVIFEANNVISSFYSRVILLQSNQIITSQEAAAYNSDFDLLLASFSLK